MADISITDLLIHARQESHRMRHFFLGVEHLFIAMLEAKGSITASILIEKGLTPEYIIDSIRRKVAKGSRHRLWAGMPNTPRTDVVLGVAQEIASEEGRKHIIERDILLAILDEADSIPVRALLALGLDCDDLRHQALAQQTENITQTFVSIQFAPNIQHEISEEQLYILRRMFYGYGQVRIDSVLTGGYSPALVLVVTPVQFDKREDAPVVVKIGKADAILDEAQRYERYVKGTLPPLTARLEDRPTAPDSSELAGIQYTLVTDNNKLAQDLRANLGKWSGDELAQWLEDRLFNNFAPNWWQQSRSYLFDIWQEYDWLLPPILTLKFEPDAASSDSIFTMRYPIRRSKVSALKHGDTLIIENFIVQKVDYESNTIRLAIGQGMHTTRAFQIDIQGVDLDDTTYYRGEVVEKIVGRVWLTRRELITNAVRILEPSFDITQEFISINNIRLPNPLFHYETLLDEKLHGTLSTIHGDLHAGNIILGPDDNALLIDFGLTREGHTLFDWATLEVSLLAELIEPIIGDGWDNILDSFPYLVAVNQTSRTQMAPPELSDALLPILHLRQIVKMLLADSTSWNEYYVALALVAMRAVSWETMRVDQRRLMFLVAMIAFYEYYNDDTASNSNANTPMPDDETDFYS